MCIYRVICIVVHSVSVYQPTTCRDPWGSLARVQAQRELRLLSPPTPAALMMNDSAYVQIVSVEPRRRDSISAYGPGRSGSVRAAANAFPILPLMLFYSPAVVFYAVGANQFSRALVILREKSVGRPSWDGKSVQVPSNVWVRLAS
jgi:hypothetical protein